MIWECLRRRVFVARKQKDESAKVDYDRDKQLLGAF